MAKVWKEVDDSLIGSEVWVIQKDVFGNLYIDENSHIIIGFTSKGIVTWNDYACCNDYFDDGMWFDNREDAEVVLNKLRG